LVKKSSNSQFELRISPRTLTNQHEIAVRKPFYPSKFLKHEKQEGFYVIIGVMVRGVRVVCGRNSKLRIAEKNPKELDENGILYGTMGAYRRQLWIIRQHHRSWRSSKQLRMELT
jgi:hypothetical protein